jgi:type IV pilus assembly protein PilE
MRTVRGFTLLELMITVAIVAILASIALPVYNDYITRGKLVEAHAALGAQRVRMEQYYQDLRTYTGACDAGTVATVSDTQHFELVGHCDITAGGQGYLLHAIGKAGTDVEGFEFTVNEANQRATVSAKTGWTANATCWVRNKGGEC